MQKLRSLRPTTAAVALALVLVGRAAAQEPETVALHLAGTVAGRPVRVELSITAGAVTGTYVYEGARPAFRSVVDALFLTGRAGAAGALDLEESVSDIHGNQKSTGRWRVRLERRADGARLAGTWSAPGGRGLPVSLAEVRQTPAGSRLDMKVYAEPDPRFQTIVRFEYPQIAGAPAFNTAVERLVAGEVGEFKQFMLEDGALGRENAGLLALEGTYEVAAAPGDLVSVVFTVYTNFGGAHPTSRQVAITFDTRRGRTLDLADLFRDKRGYARALAARAAPVVPKEPALSVDPARYEAWYVTPNGLWLVYPVAHVAGDYASVYLPFGALRDVLDPKGPVWALASPK